MSNERIQLIKPTKKYENQLIEYKKEHFDNNESHISASSKWYKINDYNKWLNLLKENEEGNNKEGCVVSTEFLGIRQIDDRVVGLVNIRHELTTEFLKNYAGHIGYGVRPTERRKGYATQMLAQALKYCKTELKLKKVMISCDKNNEASRKTIVNAGGILEKEYIAEDGENVQIYWIILE